MPIDDGSTPSRRPLRVLVAPDKFKGTMDAGLVAETIIGVLGTELPDVSCTACPVADGGDGLLAAAIVAGFQRIPMVASGPTGQPVPTAYARRGDTAVVELAEICGLDRMTAGPEPARLDPMYATTRGVGEVILTAVRAGSSKIILGLGGSASTDGGAGMLCALGARVLDAAGDPVRDGGAGLARAHKLDLSTLAPELSRAHLLVASDVDNPLLGPLGAAEVYGPQKGADAAQIRQLDAGLAGWADLVADATGHDHRDVPGAGAAGGTGFGVLAVLGADLRPGIDLVLALTGFHAALADADLVITGEGSLDAQTLHGKAPAGVAAAARARGVPVIAVCGRRQLSPVEARAAGFDRVYALTDVEPDPRQAMAYAVATLTATTRRLAGDLRRG